MWSFQAVCDPLVCSLTTSAILYYTPGVMQVHTLSMSASRYNRNDLVQLCGTPHSCCQRYLLTKTWENRNKSGGLIQIISFWTTFISPLPMPAVFEQLDFISGKQPVCQQTSDENPSLNVSTAGSVLALLRWSAVQTHSTAHILLKSAFCLWSVLSNTQ